MLTLSVTAWVLLIVGAFSIGVAKASVQNLAFVGVGAAALVLPARESTAVVVVMLVVADIVAVIRYHKQCDWRLVRKLLPYVIPGEILGLWFLSWVSDSVLKVVIGVLLLFLLAPQIVPLVGAGKTQEESRPIPQFGRAASAFVGTLAGFTTMAANASGPIFTWYLLMLRVNKAAFLGTGAIYFGIVNALKIPLGFSIGLFTPEMLAVDAVLIPVVLLGTVAGSALVRRMSQRTFDIIAVGMSLVAAVALLIPG